MNVLRKDDDDLTTADLVNSSRNRPDSVTPRQAYNSGLEPTQTDPDRTRDVRDNPPDYTPPPSGPQNTQANLGSTQANLGSTQANLGSTQANLGSTQANLGSTQANLGSTQANAASPPPSPGPRPVASQIPPAAPVAPVPGPAAPAPGPVAVSQSASGPGHPGALFPEDELHNFRARWDQVQTSFVDEPRKAVEGADSLVANVVKRIAEQFANERETLEKQWDRGDNVNTEDLRQALKRYRAFFDRLLSF